MFELLPGPWPNGANKATDRVSDNAKQAALQETAKLRAAEFVAREQERMRHKLAELCIRNSYNEYNLAVEFVQLAPGFAPFGRQLLQVSHGGRLDFLDQFNRL
jgi:hypothetical protein